MSEKNSEKTLYQQQKENKPKIENIISETIDNENTKKAALDFVAWLRANKMSPSWYAQNSWKVNYKGKKLFTMGIHDGNLHIRYPRLFTEEYQEFITNNNLQNIVWDNMYPCPRCNGGRCNGCPPPPYVPGVTANICGKEINNLCRGVIQYFINPDNETTEGLKKLLEFSRQTI